MPQAPQSTRARTSSASAQGKPRREHLHTLTPRNFCRIQNDILDLNNSQMAEALDVSERAVEEYRSGRRKVQGPLALLLMMVQNAGLTPTDLVGALKTSTKPAKK